MDSITNYILRKNNKYGSTINTDDTESLVLVNDIFKADKIDTNDVYYYHTLLGYDVLKVTNNFLVGNPELVNIITSNNANIVAGDGSQKQLVGDLLVTNRTMFGKKVIINVSILADLGNGNLALTFNGYPTNELYGQTAIVQGEHNYQFIIDFTELADTQPTTKVEMFIQMAYFTGNIKVTGASMFVLSGKGYVLTSGRTFITNFSKNDSSVNITSTTDFNQATIYDDYNGNQGKEQTGYELLEIQQDQVQLTEDEINALQPATGGGGNPDPTDPSNQPAEPGFNGVGGLS